MKQPADSSAIAMQKAAMIRIATSIRPANTEQGPGACKKKRGKAPFELALMFQVPVLTKK
ncbi:hypothetical protein D3C72_2401760 [compost metagenome]